MPHTIEIFFSFFNFSFSSLIHTAWRWLSLSLSLTLTGNFWEIHYFNKSLGWKIIIYDVGDSILLCMWFFAFFQAYEVIQKWNAKYFFLGYIFFWFLDEFWNFTFLITTIFR